MNLARGVTLLRSLEGHGDGITCLAFDRQGEVLASGSADETVKLWDPASGQLLRTLHKLQGKVTSVAFDPEGGTLAAGTCNKDLLRVWEVRGGTLVRKLEPESVNSLAYHPRGGLMAGGSSLRRVQLWEAGSGKLLRSLAAHDKGVNSVAFHPAGEVLASGSDDETVRLWAMDGGSLLHTLKRHQKSVRSVAFDSKGELLASGSGDTTVKIWEPQGGRLLRSLEGHRSLVEIVTFSPDGRLLASRGRDHTIRLWSCETWETVAVIPMPTRASYSAPALEFHPKMPMLATAGSEVGTSDEERSRLVLLLELDYDLLLGRRAAQASSAAASPPKTVKVVGPTESVSPPPVGPREVPPKAPAPVRGRREAQVEMESRHPLDERRLRFERAVARVKEYAAEQKIMPPDCFISYAWGVAKHELWIEKQLATDLKAAGFQVLLDRWENVRIGSSLARFVQKIGRCHFVVVVGTPRYLQKTANLDSDSGSIAAAEWDVICRRMLGSEDKKRTVLPVLLAGEDSESFPELLLGRVFGDFRKVEDYFAAAFNLILSLYQLPPTLPIVVDLLDSLESAAS